MPYDDYYRQFAPLPENALTYKWENQGYFKNAAYNEITSLWGITPFRHGKRCTEMRCADLYPIMYGDQYAGFRGCTYFQFHDEGDLIRCKNCLQSFVKTEILSVFGEVEGLQVTKRRD